MLQYVPISVVHISRKSHYRPVIGQKIRYLFVILNWTSVEDTMVDIMHNIISKVFCSSETIQASGRKLSLECWGGRGGAREQLLASNGQACLLGMSYLSQQFHRQSYKLVQMSQHFEHGILQNHNQSLLLIQSCWINGRLMTILWLCSQGLSTSFLCIFPLLGNPPWAFP